MKYILTNSQIRDTDESAIEEYGIPSVVLMENAARSSAEYIVDILSKKFDYNADILILCGSGNNGGDGFAVARQMQSHFNVRIVMIGNQENMSPETGTNFHAALKLGIPCIHLTDSEEIPNTDFYADCIIDAMIGVGGSENIRGIAAEILKTIKNINALKIAIDAPSGLNTDSGAASPDCFKADYTVTMFAIKRGMLLKSGPDYCGKVLTAYLGAPDFIVRNNADIFSLEDADIKKMIPERQRVSSKFDYGKVVVIAGSKKYPGAAALCANAAITSGAGLVHLYTTVIHSSLMPEVIPHIMSATKDGSISDRGINIILKDAERADTVVIGPGLGTNPETLSCVRKVLEKVSENTTVVIDADGLKTLDDKYIMSKNVILTPHTGELARITGIPRKEIEDDSARLTLDWAEQLNCIILLKHVPVFISDGEISYWNTNGNPGMATGGMGDVLAGIIAGLSACGAEPLQAAAAAAYIHGKAGDLYAEKYSQLSLTASRLSDCLEEVTAKLL
ncbi:MAG: NAD(P)H-hydrate dehydratase [Chlorobi bacterium]|nr:NAD(P)H-hydrate dehydratase [Chlorobiota bacterium]